MPDPSSTAAQWITGADRPVDAYNVTNVTQDLRDKYNRFVTAVVTKVSSMEQSQKNLHANSSTVVSTIPHRSPREPQVTPSRLRKRPRSVAVT